MMTTEDAIFEFREAAIEKGDLCRPAQKDHLLARKMADAVRFLRSKGEAGQKALASLLNDPSPHVRSWVAAELLSRGNVRARAVLEALAEEPGLVGLTAQVTLSEYHKGRLSSPFGAAGDGPEN